jgi:hypothetical protein
MIGGSSPGRGWEFFAFTTVTRPSVGPTKPPILLVPGALFLGIKRPESEADHPPPSSAEVKNAWSYTSAPTIRLHSVVISYKREKKSTGTTLYLYLLLDPSQGSLKWAGYVARMRGMIIAYRILVGDLEDNIKFDLKEKGYEGVDWIHLVQQVYLAHPHTVAISNSHGAL